MSVAASRWKRASGVIAARNAACDAFKAVPHGIDASTFFSPGIPAEVRAAVPPMYSMDQAVFRRILEAAVAMLQGQAMSDADFAAFEESLGGADNARVGQVLTGVHTILRTAVRNRTKADVVQRDLTEMNVPAAFVADVVRAVKVSRGALEDAAVANRIRFPKLDALGWRVDVAISTSSLTRAFKPTVVMQMALSDGRIKTFEVPIDQFNQLRFNVAKVLRDMKQLESHPIMRLAFDADKKNFDERAAAAASAAGAGASSE